MVLSIQYMRALAALLVVLSHVAIKGEQYSTSPLSWFHIGSAGVDLFFIISGYIMCHTVTNRKVGFNGFIIARIKRILPLYWLLTTAALVVFLLLPEKVNSSGGVTNILHSYTLFPTVDKYLIQNGWTLSYEFYFYFLFSSCLLFNSAWRFFVPVFVILALVATASVYENENYLVGFFTNPLLVEFVAGILIFYLFQEKGVGIKVGLCFICLAIFLLVFVNESVIDVNRTVRYGIPMLLFFIGMLALEPVFKKVQGMKVSRLFQSLGASSYSLYLCHPFALVICAVIFKKLGLHDNGFVFSGLLMSCSILSGHLCYVLIEKRLIRIFSRKKSVVLKPQEV